MEHPDIAKLEEEIKEVLKKHENVSATLIIQVDGSDEHLICGNMCVRCALEMLMLFIVVNGIGHKKDEVLNEIDQAYKKASVN